MGRKKKDEINLEDFKYVDAFHMNPQTNQRTKWVRIESDKIEDFAQQHNNYNVFATVQMYRNKVRQEGGGEVMYAPLFFDIDSKRQLANETDGEGKKKPKAHGLIEMGVVKTSEVAGMLPPELVAHLNNHDMGIDLPDSVCTELNKLSNEVQELKDYLWIKNLEMSRQDAVKLMHFFMEKFDMTEDEIRVFFSGSKGFHVIVNPIVLGIKPHKNLHKVFKFIANNLETQLSLQSLDTGSIYGHGRMLRLVNSLHYKSGLFKVELSHEELKGDLRNVVNSLSKSPRPDMYPPEVVEYNLNDQAHEWFQGYFGSWEEAEKLQADRVTLKDEVLSKMEGLPVCVQFILERGILKSGDRNKATMALASYYKDTGTPQNETSSILVDWVKKIPKSFTSSTPSEVEASTVGCVKTVYTDDKYHFGCAFIRSLHGERQGRDYEAVPCAGRACPAHEDYAIDQEPAEGMHLAQTANAQYTGKKVAFSSLVSGKMDTPYIVPKKVRYVCSHEPFCDKDCIMHDYSGLYEREFHENERFLIEATGQNDNNMKGILFHHSGASCKKVKSEVLESANVTELLVVPMAERVKTVKTEDGHKDVDESGNEYVSRKIYAVGEPNEIPKSNEHYDIEGYVYAHPRNAMATILTQKHEPVEDSVGKFELTEDMKEQFKTFQVAPGEDIDDRVSLLIDDLTANVTLVRERFEPHLAVMMTYHSVLNYYFQGQLEKRGWLETVFVGDSGQAKTQLVNNIMEYAGLGNMTSGEGTSRTGLVYRLEQLGERWFITWGKYPLSDRKLIAIDEFSELHPDDFGKITEARTTGVLRVDRTVNTETNARVRLVLLTNPTRARTLSSFSHGVESLKPLFASPADIRRLDLALFLQSGDVSKSVLNKEYAKPATQLISSEALRNSILWAWSRKADQVEITKPAMKKILKKADELAEKYGYAQDIPLMEPSDLRKKLARMSIALASMLHSTDDTHEKVIVHPEHVDYVADFISVVYDNPNARLDIYSAKSKEESELTDEERETVTKAMEDLDFADNVPVSEEIMELFRKNDILKPAEIIDMLGFERSQVNSRLSILTKHSMIKRTRDGLRKLPKFIEFLTTD
jgi:antitoxin component HigA of HigAB toxin-antitoxin module